MTTLIETGYQSTVRNVSFDVPPSESGVVAVEIGGDGLRLTNCDFNMMQMSGEAITNPGDRSYLIITDNYISGGDILMGDAYQVTFADNILIYQDVIFEGAAESVIANNTGIGRLVVDGFPWQVQITDNTLSAIGTYAIELTGFPDACRISGNEMTGGILMDGAYFCRVSDNVIRMNSDIHGVHLVDTEICVVADNQIEGTSGGTQDAIHLEGSCTANDIRDNKIVPWQSRWGINLADSTVEDSVVVGNHYGEASQYSSGPYNDDGSGTIDMYPTGGLGSNFAT